MDNCQHNSQSKVYQWLNVALNQLRLFRCVKCQKAANQTLRLCASCFQQLPWHQHYCRHCGVALSESVLQQGFDSCGHCIVLNQTPFDRVHVAFHFEDPVRQWINDLKFHNQLIYGKLFAECLAQRIELTSADTQVLPMPLHWRRLNERGYNQSSLVAKPLAKALNLSYCDRTLLRRKNTPHQIGLSKAKREQNVRAAFECKQAPAERVLLVDDVMTTGSTAYAAAACLKRAGAMSVELALIARAG